MKKRYNKLVAYLLMDFSTLVLLLPVGLVMLFTNQGSIGIELILAGVISILPATLLTLYINSRTPKGERIRTWLRAWWLGFKIAWKIALCCTLVLIPTMLKWNINIASCDASSNLNNGERFVYDEDGNRYEIINNENIKDESGEWHRVWTNSDGYKFIEINGNKIYLR